MHSPTSERRIRVRSRIQFPVVIFATASLPEGQGVTRDISPAGVYFYTESALDVGHVIDFRMLLPLPGHGNARAMCRGTVVRVEKPVLGGVATRGVGVAITNLKMEWSEERGSSQG